MVTLCVKIEYGKVGDRLVAYCFGMGVSDLATTFTLSDTEQKVSVSLFLDRTREHLEFGGSIADPLCFLNKLYKPDNLLL